MLTPPRSLRPTVEGGVYMLMIMAVAGAALNTGNNLLYLLCAMSLGLVAISGVLSESAIRRIKLARRLPGDLHAGEPAQGRILLSNERRWLPNVAMTIGEESGTRADGGGGEITVVHLAAGDRASRRMDYTFHRRGLHRLRGFRISTRFPFGLFLKSYRLKDSAEVLVYPRLAGEPPPTGSHPASQGNRSGQRTGLDGDFRGLRDFAEGEDARRIHWKTSARRDQLVAVERSDGNRERATVHLLPGAVPATAPGFADDFERQVSQAARAACDLLAAGHEVGLLTPAGYLAPRTGLAQRREVLRHLALIPTPRAPLIPRLSTLRGQLGGHDVVVA
jgi:uncharacterized protein (DUF58 family)